MPGDFIEREIKPLEEEHIEFFGLHNDLQTEASVVGNLVFPLILDRFGTPEQKQKLMAGAIAGESGFEIRPDRARPRVGRDVAGDPRRTRRRRLG